MIIEIMLTNAVNDTENQNSYFHFKLPATDI
jgi:hypothetical protein